MSTIIKAFVWLLIAGVIVVNTGCHRSPSGSPAANQVELWLTNPDKSALFQKQPSTLAFLPTSTQQPTITVDDAQTFQSIDGFGYTLTGGSAMLIHRMEAKARTALLHELFATDGGAIGVSYLRLSIGASDMDDHVFSYDDLPEGQTDPSLSKFSLDPD